MPTRGRQPTTLIERRGFGSLRIGWNWRDPRKTNCGAPVTARERDVSEANQYEIHTATRNVQPPLLLRSVLARQVFRKKQEARMGSNSHLLPGRGLERP